jgi:YVTN family beta-propeller protein
MANWTREAISLAAALFVVGLFAPAAGEAARPRVSHEPKGFATLTSPQGNPIALSPDGSRVWVVNTTSDSVSVIDANTFFVIATIEVGMEPSSVAVRPDGAEVWVTNHVSDSVSIIDPSIHRVVATISPLDAKGVTTFDEPVGIAFASNSKAYVALSSRNQVAVIDVATRTVASRLNITAQEPRALAVRNGLLYVAAFESGNRTEMSVCPTTSPGDQCTLDNQDLGTFITQPNLPGEIKNIVVDPDVPDRDLFVFDTATDTLVPNGAVTGVGTLLYGLAIGSDGTAYVTQTDARNAVNGLEGLNLIDLDNRMFSNEIARVTCTPAGCGAAAVTDLEPANPTHATALATPYGVALSADGSVLVAVASGSSRIFTMDTATMTVKGRLDLGTGADLGQQIPKGVALRSLGGAPFRAYVLNTLENTVSVIDVSDTTDPVVLVELAKIPIGSDPTPLAVRKGNIAFNNAFASDTGTFSCGSCHPDGNMDQLLWRIGGACTFGACSEDDEPRTTMPVRGLKNTLPLHWDGTLGDPFGGTDGSLGGGGNSGTDCSLGGPDGDHDCFVHLVNGSLSGVMCDQSGTCNPGGNQLSAQEIDDMASFLAGVWYPPARSRRLNDTISTAAAGDTVALPNGDGSPSTTQVNALSGFKAFFTDKGGAVTNPDTCADSDAGCHELPLGVATNSVTLAGFDAPTMRGLTDRFLQFSLGPTNAEEMLVQANTGGTIQIPPFPPVNFQPLEVPIQWDPNQGFREITTFGVAFAAFQLVYAVRPIHIFQMLEEASTGFSGAVGRQVTLSQATTTGGALAATDTLLTQLETADARGLVNLRGTGRYGSNVTISYRAATNDYQIGGSVMTHGDLITQAQAGTLIATLTGFLPKNFGSPTHPQPLLAEGSTNCGGVNTGDPPIPAFSHSGGSVTCTVTGTDIRCGGTSGPCTEPILYVDGQPVAGSLSCTRSGDFCANGNVSFTLNARPAQGLHVLQVQNPLGPLSNELPICSSSTVSACRN